MIISLLLLFLLCFNFFGPYHLPLKGWMNKWMNITFIYASSGNVNLALHYVSSCIHMFAYTSVCIFYCSYTCYICIYFYITFKINKQTKKKENCFFFFFCIIYYTVFWPQARLMLQFAWLTFFHFPHIHAYII